MAKKFPIRTFIDDLILRDRRLAERADITLQLDFAEVPTNCPIKCPTTGRGPGLTVYDLRKRALGTSRSLRTGNWIKTSTSESDCIGMVVVYCLCREQLPLAYHIGEILKEVRTSLNLSQHDVARHTGTGRFAVWKWEAGARDFSVSQRCTNGATLLDWCHPLERLSSGQSIFRPNSCGFFKKIQTACVPSHLMTLSGSLQSGLIEWATMSF